MSKKIATLSKGCDAFGPKPICSPDFWSPTSCPHGQTIPIKFGPHGQMVPKNLVPQYKWSPRIWSLWTNGPQPIWSPYFWIPTACPPGRKEYSRDHLSMGTKLVGDHLSTGTEFLGTICPWGLNWLGTVCPEGPINWGPIVGDQMSGDHMCLGPNVSQPFIYAILANCDFSFLTDPDVEHMLHEIRHTYGLQKYAKQNFTIIDNILTKSTPDSTRGHCSVGHN